MSDENPNEKQSVEKTTKAKEGKVDRRRAARRLGKILTYTAPALIALSTGKNASGGPYIV
jgi:hypothetical protein